MKKGRDLGSARDSMTERKLKSSVGSQLEERNAREGSTTEDRRRRNFPSSDKSEN